MRFRSRLLTFATVLLTTATAATVQAQRQEPFEIIRGTDTRARGTARTVREAPFEIVRGTSQSRVPEPAATAAPDRSAASARQPRPLTRQERQALAERHERLTGIESELIDSSYDSFRRGLMSLYDHLDQLNLVLEAEYSRAADDAARIALMNRHRDRLRRVAQDLNQFNQPASAGWFADLLLAQAMLAQVDLDLAVLEGNNIAAAEAAEMARTLAQRHMQQREFDATLGNATLSLVVQAALLTPEGAAQGREILQDAVAATRRWNRQGAFIGRKDRVAEIELELSRFEFFAELDKEDGNVVEALERAEEASTRLLNSAMEYYGTKTAPLFHVARAWNMRRQLYDIAASSDEALFTKERQELSERDLAQIVTFAEEATDRRGRIAADVAYITLLNELSKPLPVQQSSESRSPAASAGAETQR